MPLTTHSAFRLFWQASADFAPDGWARRRLETLRLLCANLAADRPLGERTADRLGAAVSAVRIDVLDRLEDVRLSAREGEGLLGRRVRLERGAAALASGLDGVRCRAGAPPPLDTAAVGSAIDDVITSCDGLRAAAARHVVADLGAVLTALGGAAAEHPAVPVAVRPSDLWRALDALLERVPRNGAIQLEPGRRRARLAIRWQREQAGAGDAEPLLAPLRALASYGVEVVLEEDAATGLVSLEALLPPAERSAGPRS
jgi:hypothetical protein